jgi:hypothetical protein
MPDELTAEAREAALRLCALIDAELVRSELAELGVENANVGVFAVDSTYYLREAEERLEWHRSVGAPVYAIEQDERRIARLREKPVRFRIDVVTDTEEDAVRAAATASKRGASVFSRKFYELITLPRLIRRQPPRPRGTLRGRRRRSTRGRAHARRGSPRRSEADPPLSLARGGA